MDNLKQEPTFESQDLHLSSTIYLLTGIYPSTSIKNNLLYYVFPHNEKVMKAVSDYHRGVDVNVFNFCKRLKQVRHLGIKARQEVSRNEKSE